MSIERLRFPDEQPERLPPNNQEAEEAVLGSVLLDREVVGRVAGIVAARDFYRERNGLIYQAMLDLYERGTPVDYVTLLDELDRIGKVELAGGLPYLASLLGAVPTPINAEVYARRVADFALLRRLISAGGRIAQLGFQSELEVGEALERAEAALSEVSSTRRDATWTILADVLGDAMEEWSAMRAEQGLAYRIPTGHVDLDRLLGGGFSRGNLWILAARPGMGKSTLAMGIACRLATVYDATVAVFSLEMGKGELVSRLVASESMVTLDRLRSSAATLTTAETDRLGVALGRLGNARIWFDDTPGLSIGAIRTRARQLATRQPLDLVIIDHMQLISASRPGLNPVQAMSEISFALKGLARDLNVPVLALSQLSRAVEQRTKKVPMLSDLRESGSIEQDADGVVFIYRDDVYNPDSERASLADLYVEKHRNGPTGQVTLFFNARMTRFLDLEVLLP